MKASGRGMIKNAWRSAKRINPNLLEVQLYKSTLETQFSFNVKHSSKWGLIPSCSFVPDGKSVIMELSGLSRDSEDGLGGHHFSLVAHLKNPEDYKAVAMPPCPDESPIVSATPASSAVKPIEERDLPAETVAKKSPSPSSATVAPIATKNPEVEKKKPEAGAKKKGDCDPCPEIAKLKTDVEAIQASVDNLKQAISSPASDKGSALGVVSTIEDVQKETRPTPVLAPEKKPVPLGKKEKDLTWMIPWWILLFLLLLILLIDILRKKKRGQLTTPDAPNQPANQDQDDDEAIPLTEPAEPADPEEDK